jgi:hypothetical protein
MIRLPPSESHLCRPATRRRAFALCLRPAALVGAGYGVVLLLLLVTHAWDPLFFATLGPQWLRHDPQNRRAADGTIYHAIAREPFGATGAGAYRQQRILYPLLAHVLALGSPSLIPWTLVLANWAAIVLGTEILYRLLLRAGAPGWMALAYGAWAGLGLALLKDTAEPVTYLSALLGIWWLERGKTRLAYPAFLGSLLGRETALLLVAPYLFLADGRRTGIRRWLPGLLVLGLWRAWVIGVRLWLHGTPSSGHRWWLWLIPLLGFRATRPFDLPFSVIYLLVPAAVMLVLAVRRLRRTPADPALWAIVLNALLVLSLPRGTAALVWHSARVSTGFVASLVLATSLQHSMPRTWRVLATLFASSAGWTIAAVVRYLFWDVFVVPGS